MARPARSCSGDKTRPAALSIFQVKGDPRVYTVQSFSDSISIGPLKDLRSRTLAPAINYDEVTLRENMERNGTVIEVKRKTDAEDQKLPAGIRAVSS